MDRWFESQGNLILFSMSKKHKQTNRQTKSQTNKQTNKTNTSRPLNMQRCMNVHLHIKQIATKIRRLGKKKKLEYKSRRNKTKVYFFLLDSVAINTQ